MFKTIFKSLDKNARPTDTEIEKIPSFIYCRWLGGSPKTINVANIFNQYYNEIDIVNQWKMVHNTFAGSRLYIPYPKNNKQNNSKDVDIICKHYNINETRAREYMEFITDEQLLELRTINERKA